MLELLKVHFCEFSGFYYAVICAIVTMATKQEINDFVVSEIDLFISPVAMESRISIKAYIP